MFSQEQVADGRRQDENLEHGQTNSVMAWRWQVVCQATKEPAGQPDAKRIANGPKKATQPDDCAAMFGEIDVGEHGGPVGWVG